MENNNGFTEGKVLSPLIRFALPILFAIFLQTMYGAVDMLVVGQFCHAGEVSAVSTGSWIMQTVTSFITGLTMGTTVLLGNRIGAGKAQDGGRVVGVSILLFLAIGTVLTLVLELLAVPFARMMQAPQEAFDSTVLYIRICGAGTLFIIAFNVLGGVFRGIGNAKLPLISVSIACVTNIVGDLLLVGVFGWGAAGAAAATVLAQAISVVISILIIRRMELPFSFSKQDLRWERPTAGQVVRLGLPIATQDLLVLHFLFGDYGHCQRPGGYPVSRRRRGGENLWFCFDGSIGLYAGDERLCGTEHGRRAAWTGRKKALAGAIGTSLAVGVVLSYFSFFHGGLLAQLFARTQPLSRRRRNTSKPMPLTVCSCLSCFALWATLTAVGALLLS